MHLTATNDAEHLQSTGKCSILCITDVEHSSTQLIGDASITDHNRDLSAINSHFSPVKKPMDITSSVGFYSLWRS